MGLCCRCDSRPDLYTEVYRSMAEGSTAINTRFISSGNEKILFRQKENPLKDYSLMLFQELNKFRTEPENYYLSSVKYNFEDTVKELVNIKNQKKGIDLRLEWSSKKEKIISNIMNDDKIND